MKQTDMNKTDHSGGRVGSGLLRSLRMRENFLVDMIQGALHDLQGLNAQFWGTLQLELIAGTEGTHISHRYVFILE